MDKSRKLGLIFAMSLLCVSGCSNERAGTTINHQFSVEVPEFLEVTPEASFKFYEAIEPDLKPGMILQVAEANAPAQLLPLIREWMSYSGCITANQFGQNRINFQFFGPGTGNVTDDTKFIDYLQESIENQIKQAIAAQRTHEAL